MIKLVVFDLWNTLIPISLDFSKLVEVTNHEHLSRGELIAKYEQAVQLKKYNSFKSFKKDFFKAFNQENNITLEELLVEVYIDRVGDIKFYPDIKNTLLKLKKLGIKIALLSNAEGFEQERIEKILSLRKYFDSLTYSFEVKALKPDKKMFLKVLKKHKVKPNEALMVGDSLRADIIGAKNVNMHAVWINRKGKSFDLADTKPEFEINSMTKLTSVIEIINKKG